jgi:sec-independent protein translocase protein TatA
MTEYMNYIMAWMPGILEWIIILGVALLIFGRRLPEVARGLGRSIVEFKKGLSETSDIQKELTDEVKKVKDDVVNETKRAAGPNDTGKTV